MENVEEMIIKMIEEHDRNKILIDTKECKIHLEKHYHCYGCCSNLTCCKFVAIKERLMWYKNKIDALRNDDIIKKIAYAKDWEELKSIKRDTKHQ